MPDPITPTEETGVQDASSLADIEDEVDAGAEELPGDPPTVEEFGDDVNESPDNPHALAGRFLATVAHLRHHRSEFVRWDGSAYVVVPDDEIRSGVCDLARAVFLEANKEELASWIDAPGEKRRGPPTVRPVTQRLVGDVLQALRALCRIAYDTDPPAWIDGSDGPPPSGVVSTASGLLDLAAAAAGRPDCLLEATPGFYTRTALPYEFRPRPPRPSEWLHFSAALWPDDPESIATIQEWCGYLLSGDTRLQKILLLIGPTRSGKGVILRVLSALLGASNVCGPTLAGLAGQFGLAPLLGKSAALVSDVRLSARTDTATIAERLLSISGEDTLSVPRKYRDPVDARLGVRFVIASNELPQFTDASSALASRFVVLRMTHSFLGREDTGLSDRIVGTEMPGVLRWAIAGWRRLRDRGRFAPPATGAELSRTLADLASPVGAFVFQRCVVAADATVSRGELYAEWRKWCDMTGRKEPGNDELFGKHLRAAVPLVGDSRPREDGGRVRMYTGIRLRRADEPAG